MKRCLDSRLTYARRLAPRLVLLTAVLGFAATVSLQAIVGGEPDGKRHPFVGLIAYQLDPGGPWYVPPGGSANLVSRTVAVTAGHVLATPLTRPVLGVEPYRRGVVFDPVPVDTQAPFDLPGGFRVVPTSSVQVAREVAWHPDLLASPETPNDIGVIVFEKPVKGVPLAHIPGRGLFDLLARLFDFDLEIVGYGGTQLGCCPPPGGGNRYSGPASLVDLTPDVVVTGVLEAGEVSAAVGDSGSPALLGRHIIVGVMSSFGPNPDPAQFPFTRFSRTDSRSACAFLSQYLAMNCRRGPFQ